VSRLTDRTSELEEHLSLANTAGLSLLARIEQLEVSFPMAVESDCIPGVMEHGSRLLLGCWATAKTSYRFGVGSGIVHRFQQSQSIG
jgi:hypothetical protein